MAGLLGLQNYSFAFMTVMPARKQAFNEKFTKDKLEPFHKLHLGQDADPPAFGYPDMGAGSYSKKLPYYDWFKFNCAQRIHSNSIEHLSWALPLLLVGGIFTPRFSSAMGLTVFVGRELYRYGYMTNEGANSHIRELGAIPLNAAEVFMILGVGALALKYFFGPFLGRRRLIKRFTMSKVDRKTEEVLEEIKK